jgi:hypothetical protein
VHTGAWLTQPDAQKVKRLRQYSNRAIGFEPNFINAVARRFHRIVKAANQRLLTDCTALLGPTPDAPARDNLQTFLTVSSPKNTWL